MSHTCHAIGCRRQVPREIFMCVAHWSRLTATLRTRIWRAYRKGQCEDWSISREYANVAQDCLKHIAAREGRVLTGKEPELTLYDRLAEGAT